MFNNIDNNKEEMIDFTWFGSEGGDAIMGFEGGEDMFVSDLTSYYAISEEWLPLEATEGEQSYQYSGSMPRSVYAELFKEYKEQLNAS